LLSCSLALSLSLALLLFFPLEGVLLRLARHDGGRGAHPTRGITPVLAAHFGRLEAMARHPRDARRYLTAGTDGTLCLWDVGVPPEAAAEAAARIAAAEARRAATAAAAADKGQAEPTAEPASAEASPNADGDADTVPPTRAPRLVRWGSLPHGEVGHATSRRNPVRHDGRWASDGRARGGGRRARTRPLVT